MLLVGVSSAATMGARRFFSTGGIITQSLAKRDMFRVGSNLYQCNKNHMLSYLLRSLPFSSASQSSGETTPHQEFKEEKECQLIRNSQLQIERSCDEISSAKVCLNQFPGLMVHGMVEDSTTRRLLRLNPGTGYFEQEQDVAAGANHDHGHHNELQVPHGNVCRGSAYGWLFLTDDNLDMNLFNPFSGEKIKLPPMNTLPFPTFTKGKGFYPPTKYFVSKAAFSANPSVEPRPVVMIIYAGERTQRLAFCKPGDETWTLLGFPIKMHFEWCFVLPVDVIYHKGQFYVLALPGYVAAYDIGRCIDDDDLSVKTTLVATAADRKPTYMRDSHLAVLDGELVRFEITTGCLRDYCILYDDDDELMKTRDGDTSDGIKIWRFDKSEKQWVKVESLGDKAVFLGYNTSFALSATDYPAGHCIPNSIYYTHGDDGNEDTEMVSRVMGGIYNVEDKSVKPLYPPMPTADDDSDDDMPAPIWIVNSSSLASC